MRGEAKRQKRCKVGTRTSTPYTWILAVDVTASEPKRTLVSLLCSPLVGKRKSEEVDDGAKARRGRRHDHSDCVRCLHVMVMLVWLYPGLFLESPPRVLHGSLPVLTCVPRLRCDDVRTTYISCARFRLAFSSPPRPAHTRSSHSLDLSRWAWPVYSPTALELRLEA